MDEIMQDAVMFLESKDFYYEKGIPWRRGYLFYGIPGSGKTSLAIWLSTCLHKSLYCISSRDCSCGNFEDALAGLPTGAIVLIEDADCLFQSGIGSRENSRDTAGELHLGAKEDYDEDNKMTLSDFLNAVDGVSSHKDGRILIMTTNHVESIDAAILRPGRIDKKIEFTYADDYQLKLLCERMMGVEQGRRIFNEKFKGRKDPVTMAEAENMILPLALEMLEQKKSKPIQNS
jgi:chaperone BCS1